MLSDIASSPQLLEIMSTTPENESETDPSQNEKKSSYENLKTKVASLNRKKKIIISGSNTYNSAVWSFLQDL